MGPPVEVGELGLVTGQGWGPGLKGGVTAHHVASFWATLGTFTGTQSLGPRESPVGGGGPEKPPTLPRFSVEQTGDREGLAESGPQALRPRDPSTLNSGERTRGSSQEQVVGQRLDLFVPILLKGTEDKVTPLGSQSISREKPLRGSQMRWGFHDLKCFMDPGSEGEVS